MWKLARKTVAEAVLAVIAFRKESQNLSTVVVAPSADPPNGIVMLSLEHAAQEKARPLLVAFTAGAKTPVLS